MNSQEMNSQDQNVAKQPSDVHMQDWEASKVGVAPLQFWSCSNATLSSAALLLFKGSGV